VAETQEIAVARCPFCGGTPMQLTLPGGGHAVGCEACGTVGPIEYEHDGPLADRRALKSWNRRGGIGNVTVEAVKAGTPREAAISASHLSKIAEKIIDGEMGDVQAYLFLGMTPTLKPGGGVGWHLHMHRHNFSDDGIKAVCRQIVVDMERTGRAAPEQSGLILPGS
jgi:hypothetical protein